MAPELQYGVPTDVWSERALTKTFRCPPEVVTCNNAMTGLQVVSDKPYGGDKPQKICDIWDRSPDNEGYRQIIVWLNRASLFGHPGPGSERRAHRVEYYKRFYPIWYIQLPAYEDDTEGGLDRNLYLNKVRFCTFHACKDGSVRLVLCFDKQCGWLSEGYERHPPPYHVAMTRSSSRLTLPTVTELHLYHVSRRCSWRSSRIISMYPDNSDGELRDETSNSGRVYNVTDMVDGYICTKSISAAMRFNFDVFGQTTMKDESGQPIYPETAPSTVSGRTRTASKMSLNGIIAELIAACTLELPFNSIPALKVSQAPASVSSSSPTI
jgi:hypothetical protein